MVAHAVIIRLSRLRVRKAPRPQVHKPRGAVGHSWTSSSPPFSPPTPQECKMSWKYCLGTNTFSRDTLGGKGKSRSIRERWWWGVAMEKPLLVTKWPWSLGKCGPRRNLPFSRPKGRARGGKKSDSREAGQRRILDQGLRPQFHTPLYCWIWTSVSSSVKWTQCLHSSFDSGVPLLIIFAAVRGSSGRTGVHRPFLLSHLQKPLSAAHFPPPCGQCEDELVGYLARGPELAK